MAAKTVGWRVGWRVPGPLLGWEHRERLRGNMEWPRETTVPGGGWYLKHLFLPPIPIISLPLSQGPPSTANWFPMQPWGARGSLRNHETEVSTFLSLKCWSGSKRKLDAGSQREFPQLSQQIKSSLGCRRRREMGTGAGSLGETDNFGNLAWMSLYRDASGIKAVVLVAISGEPPSEGALA